MQRFECHCRLPVNGRMLEEAIKLICWWEMAALPSWTFYWWACCQSLSDTAKGRWVYTPCQIWTGHPIMVAPNYQTFQRQPFIDGTTPSQTLMATISLQVGLGALLIGQLPVQRWWTLPSKGQSSGDHRPCSSKPLPWSPSSPWATLWSSYWLWWITAWWYLQLCGTSNYVLWPITSWPI